MKTSVALCTYNGEKFIHQQLNSILTQTLEVDEIVVCDDGSTDATVSILNAYKVNYPELFKIYINEQNLRSVKNFEKAISLCENDIIFLCDQDDIWLENKVEVIVNYFENNSEITTVATNGYGIDDQNNLLNVYSLWDIPTFFAERKIPVDYFKIIAFAGNIATGASMAFRREIFFKLRPFPIFNGFHHDEWIALNAAYNNGFYFIPEKLFKYRIHNDQQVGDVFLDKTEKNKKLLIQLFDFSVSDKKFTSFKYILKRITKSYKKNKALSQFSEYAEKKKKIELHLIDLYHSHKRLMLKLFPIRYRLLEITDSLLRKRKLT